LNGGLDSQFAQQLWQLGDVGGYPPRLILAEQLGRRSPPRLTLIIDVAQRLTAGVTHDKAGGLLLDSPRREVANASVSVFVLVREGFTCGRVDEMLSAAREAIH
jgi:hypothetical protein